MLAYLLRDTGVLPKAGGVLDQPGDLMVGIMAALQAIGKKEELEQKKREAESRRAQRKMKRK